VLSLELIILRKPDGGQVREFICGNLRQAGTREQKNPIPFPADLADKKRRKALIKEH
jgi:hypothetical protein